MTWYEHLYGIAAIAFCSGFLTFLIYACTFEPQPRFPKIKKCLSEEKEKRAFTLTDRGLSKEAYNWVEQEDFEQRHKWGNQDHDIFQWLAILSEEVGELSKAVIEFWFNKGAPTDIVREAVQVATLALKIAWMMQSKSREADHPGFIEPIGYFLTVKEFLIRLWCRIKGHPNGRSWRHK